MGVGFALFAVASILDEPGRITGWLVGWLGVAGLVFRLLNWRRRPGVWALSLVFLVLAVVSCAVFESAGMPNLLHGPFPRNLLALLDYLGGFGLLYSHGRLTLAVARHNWNLRPPGPTTQAEPVAGVFG